MLCQGSGVRETLQTWATDAAQTSNLQKQLSTSEAALPTGKYDLAKGLEFNSRAFLVSS